MTNKQHGCCRCGNAKYEIDLTDAKTLICHCLDCQKHLGAPLSVFTIVPDSQFKWLQKPSGRISFSDRAERVFCANCGTYLKWEGVGTESEAEINTMTLDSPSVLNIDEEIYVRSRLPWINAVNGAAQYSAGRAL